MPRPPTVLCYICHREFGTASIGIHERNCLKKWHDENNKLPPSERLAEPVKPPNFPSIAAGTPATSSSSTVGFVDNRQIKTTGQDPNIEAYNAAAGRTKTYPTCPKCGRHFAPDRLIVHQTHCKPPPKLARRHTYEARRPDVEINLLHKPLSGKKSVPKVSGKGTASDGGNLVACSICGRTFAPDKIERHQAACRITPIKGAPPKSRSSTRRRSTSISRSQPSTRPAPTCDNCGTKVGVGEEFCARCGTPIPPMCQQCGTPLAPKAKFCSHCGRPVQANRNNGTATKTSLPALRRRAFAL